LNPIHYNELHIHGANSSVERDYLEAIDMLQSGRIDGKRLVTHTFKLDEFNKAMEIQRDADSQSMKIIVVP
jgi:L-iditol 2-dehydrogenase